MNTRIAWAIAAVLALILAIGLLLIPGFLGTLFGPGTDPGQIFWEPFLA